MEINLLWQGREYFSLENCLINITEAGVRVDSVIVGAYEGKIYRIEYKISTNLNWEVLSADVYNQHGDIRQRVLLECDGNGNWLKDSIPAPELQNCTFIDISLTPLTNSLPINRLQLKPDEHQIIQVVYIDLLGNQISTRQQKYTRLTDNTYRYENIPNDFEAVIEVDETGLVTDYPELFERKAIITSKSP